MTDADYDRALVLMQKASMALRVASESFGTRAFAQHVEDCRAALDELCEMLPHDPRTEPWIDGDGEVRAPLDAEAPAWMEDR